MSDLVTHKIISKRKAAMKKVYVGLFGLILVCSGCSSTGQTALRNDAAKTSYSVGYQVGSDFKAQNVEFYPEALVQGAQDALTGTNPQLTKEEMNSILIKLKKKIVATEQSKEKLAGAVYFAENAKRQGVTKLPSGIQYEILKPGSGSKPTIKDEVRIHYRITRLDGTEIGSTYVGAKPRTFPVSKALPGLQEVLLLMNKGAKWRVALPTATAAGGREPMDDMGVLIYEVELLSVLPADPAAEPPTVRKPEMR